MAEGIFFNMIEKLICKLGSMVAENWRMRDDLERLTENMTDIKAVVLDAEEQQSTNHQLQVWLDRLRDALDDADNLLDDFSTEDKKLQVMTKDKKAKKVRIFFSSSNPLLFTFKMTQRVKDIGKRLEALNVDRGIFKLTNRNLEERVVKHRETHSFIREEDVIGREKEKNHLLKLLLSTSMDRKENVSVLSIVGIGGLGKTALAQLLYNDKAVDLHFEWKMWVCVSDDFDVKTIAKKILESESNDEMERVQQELRKKIGARRYFLVLDDIWNEDREQWLKLMTLLMDGAKGSKIIITTRSEMVAKISGSSSTFLLKGLDEEKAWKLFTQLAFENGEEPHNQNLTSIGKDILKKCFGVPLAIRSVGSLMYSMEAEDDWLNFKDKDLVKIDEGGNRIFQLIKLSYDHLPIHLKRCFAFCSLFPKDYRIEKEMLIRLWVAQGFVQSSHERTCLEHVANEYFMSLVNRSFFQDFRTVVGDIDSCKMHDLMHDMAKHVSGNDCVIINKQGQNIDKRTRHLSFDSSLQVPSSLLEAAKLRTFLLQHYRKLPLGMSDCYLVISSLDQLRLLDLTWSNFKMLPSCIDKLKHLRYLDLSHNEQIETLPRSITKLYNLETLLLFGCFSLRKLPNDLWNLVSLRHLDLFGCGKLAFIPRGIRKLSNLQTLTLFVLDRKSKHSGGLGELRDLNNLSNYLRIQGLECLRSNPSKAKDINLTGKSNLRRLSLGWNKHTVADENEMDKDSLILEGLLSHHNLKSLAIEGFEGMTISSSILNSLTSVVSMKLYGCTRLQHLPPLHLLLHLADLELHNLPCLEWIVINSDNDNSSTFFPSLKRIWLYELHNLKGWCRCGEHKKPRDCCHGLNILDLTVKSCPNLNSLPLHSCTNYVRLGKVNEKILQHAVYHSKVATVRLERIYGLKSVSQVLEHLTELRILSIFDCEELDPCNDENGCYSMQWKQLANLRWLEFDSILKMESVPEGLRYITTLESLTIQDCPNLRHIPEWVASLQHYKIAGCPTLTSLPEGVRLLKN